MQVTKTCIHFILWSHLSKYKSTSIFIIRFKITLQFNFQKMKKKKKIFKKDLNFCNLFYWKPEKWYVLTNGQFYALCTTWTVLRKTKAVHINSPSRSFIDKVDNSVRYLKTADGLAWGEGHSGITPWVGLKLALQHKESHSVCCQDHH